DRPRHPRELPRLRLPQRGRRRLQHRPHRRRREGVAQQEEVMATPSERVIDTFAQAREYAAEAQSQLSLFIEKLNDAIQQAPTVDVTFNPIPEPTAATVPTYTQPAEYTSTLLTTLAGVLTSRLAGGTGLPEA